MHIDDTVIGRTLYGPRVEAAIASTPLVFVDFRSAGAHYANLLQTVIDALWSLPVRAAVQVSPSLDLADVILPRSVAVVSDVDAPPPAVALSVTALPPRNRPGTAGASLIFRLTAKAAPWGVIVPASADSGVIAETIGALLAGRVPVIALENETAVPAPTHPESATSDPSAR